MCVIIILFFFPFHCIAQGLDSALCSDKAIDGMSKELVIVIFVIYFCLPIKSIQIWNKSLFVIFLHSSCQY